MCVYGGGSTPVLNSKPSENSFQKWKQNKDFFRQTIAERIYYQKITLQANPKGSLLGWLKIISGRSFEIHERMKD